MPDQVPATRPRVALVYGDADAAGHVRDAMAGHVQIVYAAAAAEFDAVRLADSRATAALLNLDSCDWLDAVETRLHAAGVAVVYNDPEISCTLQGWAQARWLRHLTAKLSGSTDFDPPRPAPAELPEAAKAAEAPVPVTADAPAVDTDVDPAPLEAEAVAVMPAAMLEQPLSLAEIASMTVNFNAVREPATVNVVDDETVGAVDTVPAVTMAAPEADAVAPKADSDAPLDVDTEALSALIDARLAAAEGQAAGDAPQVWRVAHGGAVSAVDLPVAEPGMPEDGRVDAPVASAPPSVAPVEESELMQGLPAIDDWQLVDRDAPAAPAAPVPQPARDEPALSIDFAGLELVPMEPVTQVELHTEPIERWMHVGSGDAHAADKHKQPAAPDANGGQA